MIDLQRPRRVPPLGLGLLVTPKIAPSGATLTMDLWGGAPAGRLFIAVVDVNGVPLFQRALSGNFDPQGQWAFSTVVPQGLSGLNVTFLGIGQAMIGKLRASNLQTVAFQ